MVFMMQSPIAKVYIYDISTKNNKNIDYTYLINNIENKVLFTIIKPY